MVEEQEDRIMAIDFMGYPFTKEYFENHWFNTVELMKLAKWWGFEDRVRKGWTPEEMVELMDEAGVEKHCMVQFIMRSYQDQKVVVDVKPEEMTRIIEKFPDRFIGFAGINPHKKMEGVREMERGIKDHGFKAAYLHVYGFGIPIDHKLLYPFYAKCEELGVPVSMQVGHSAEAMPSALARPILMDDIALDFPKLTLVGSHTGWPWCEEMIAMAWKHDNVYIGMDAHMPRFWDPSLLTFVKTRGRDKVIWGTNGPTAFTHEHILKQINELNLKEEVKRKLLRDNARKVLKL
ncbi:MAG: amidohydrolase family protein [Thermodesulfobacteriota bacterium]|nr:amidohydrolase family protein [Thermodesulfobacteriota bacterium]